MREINFRAWHPEKQKMYEVAKIDMWGDPDQATCDLAAIDEELFDIYLNEVELMQFTGLKDRNGAEIYEKDIVRWINSDGESVHSVVEFVDGAFRVHNVCFTLWDYLDNDAEIIGTVHDNPELIGVKNDESVV